MEYPRYMWGTYPIDTWRNYFCFSHAKENYGCQNCLPGFQPTEGKDEVGCSSPGRRSWKTRSHPGTVRSFSQNFFNKDTFVSSSEDWDCFVLSKHRNASFGNSIMFSQSSILLFCHICGGVCIDCSVREMFSILFDGNLCRTRTATLLVCFGIRFFFFFFFFFIKISFI